MTRASFGALDGTPIESISIGGEGLAAEVLTYGAILRRLTFPVRGVRRDLVLHFDSLEEYVRDRAYVGSLVGRFGNRIGGATFVENGRRHVLSANEGPNHLHGGMLGFGKRVWRVLENDAQSLTLGYTSPAGEEGYPGNLEARLELRVGASTLDIVLTAQCDAPTPVNLTWHPYFNLNAGHARATDQFLRIPASRYLPVVAGLIPTGEFASVEGSPFDFRAARRLAPPDIATHPQLSLAGGYDHCWLLDEDADCVCELSSADRDLALRMHGSGPGLQFYNGQFLARSHPALGAGVILEPQGLPNAPNEPAFPNSLLLPGETYRATIQYELNAS